MSGTVTILFSDIRGFTEDTNREGDQKTVQLLAQYQQIVRAQIKAFRGREVKTQGDSFMVSFQSAKDALRCALNIQEELSEFPLGVGIGLNTGEPVEQKGDYFGDTVNLASRICTIAQPGQVLMSESTRHVAGQIEGCRFMDIGRQRLKGYDEEKPVFTLRPAGPRTIRYKGLSWRFTRNYAVFACLILLVLTLGIIFIPRMVQRKTRPRVAPAKVLGGEFITMQGNASQFSLPPSQLASKPISGRAFGDFTAGAQIRPLEGRGYFGLRFRRDYAVTILPATGQVWLTRGGHRLRPEEADQLTSRKFKRMTGIVSLKIEVSGSTVDVTLRGTSILRYDKLEKRPAHVEFFAGTYAKPFRVLLESAVVRE